MLQLLGRGVYFLFIITYKVPWDRSNYEAATNICSVDTVDKQTCKPCLTMFDNEAVQYSETYKCLLFVLKDLYW